MVLTRAKKKSVIENLTNALKGASILVFINFRGLSVLKTTNLRRDLRRAGAKYTVVKKTLLKRALDVLGFTEIPPLEGEVGVVSGFQDITEPPRVVAKFIKQEKEGLRILGGIYESKYVADDIIKRLATIPPRDTLLTQLAFIFNQPIARFARALGEISKTKGQN